MEAPLAQETVFTTVILDGVVAASTVTGLANETAVSNKAMHNTIPNTFLTFFIFNLLSDLFCPLQVFLFLSWLYRTIGLLPQLWQHSSTFLPLFVFSWGASLALQNRIAYCLLYKVAFQLRSLRDFSAGTAHCLPYDQDFSGTKHGKVRRIYINVFVEKYGRDQYRRADPV